MGSTYPPIPRVAVKKFFGRLSFRDEFVSAVRVMEVLTFGHLPRSNRERIVRLSLSTRGGRRTVRRCDQRPFARYSSRENSTGWQAEEGGDDTNRPAPEIPVVLRGRTAALAAN